MMRTHTVQAPERVRQLLCRRCGHVVSELPRYAGAPYGSRVSMRAAAVVRWRSPAIACCVCLIEEPELLLCAGPYNLNLIESNTRATSRVTEHHW